MPLRVCCVIDHARRDGIDMFQHVMSRMQRMVKRMSRHIGDLKEGTALICRSLCDVRHDQITDWWHAACFIVTVITWNVLSALEYASEPGNHSRG